MQNSGVENSRPNDYCYFYLLLKSNQEIQMNPPQLDSHILNDLFDKKRINSGDSLAKLRALTGLHSLETLLKTSFKVKFIEYSLAGMIPLKRPSKEYQNLGTIKQLQIRLVKNHQQQQWQPQITRSLGSGRQLALYITIAVELLISIFNNSLPSQINDSLPLLIILLIYGILRYILLSFSQITNLNILTLTHHKLVKILKNGFETEIEERLLLVGDIMKIKAGDTLSVDGILISSNQILLDQSNIFQQGEISQKHSISDNESKGDPFILSGSYVLKGQGLLLVLAVGSNTSGAKVAEFDAGIEPKMNQKLNIFGEKIELIGWITLILYIIISLFHHYTHYHFQQFSLLKITSIIGIIKVALAIRIITIKTVFSESLHFCYNYCTKSIIKEGAVPMSYASAELIGQVDDICLYKTGLFTLNQMKVARFFTEGTNHSFQTRQSLSLTTSRLLGLAICNNSTAIPTFEMNDNQLKTTYKGDKLQCALLEAMYRLGFDYHRFRESQRQKMVFGFDSNRKMMATVYEDDNHCLFLFVKGAPQVLLPHCSSFISSEGIEAELTDTNADILYDIIQDYGEKSLHSILVAFKEIQTLPKDWTDICYGLIVLSIFGIKDPLRKDSALGVEMLKKSGKILRMITSDNKQTAISVAKEAGIIPIDQIQRIDDCTVMQGNQFCEFVGGLINQGTPEEAVKDIQNFKKVENQLRILARATPKDRYLLAVGLKNLGKKVAFAICENSPSYWIVARKSDVVISSKVHPVAKRSILLQNVSLTSVMGAVRWSQIIPNSVKNIVRFQINLILVSLSIIIVGTFHYGQPPFTLNQIIWVHLLLSLFVGTGLSMQAPYHSCLLSQPESSSAADQVWRNTLFQVVTLTAKFSFYLFQGPELLGMIPSYPFSENNEELSKHATLFFNIFVMTQIFNSFGICYSNCSQPTLHQLHRNRLLIIFILTAVTLQILAIRFGKIFLGLATLSLKEHLFCILLGMSPLINSVVWKVFGQRLIKLKIATK